MKQTSLIVDAQHATSHGSAFARERWLGNTNRSSLHGTHDDLVLELGRHMASHLRAPELVQHSNLTSSC